MKNNDMQPKKAPLQHTNVVYEFNCPEEGCTLLNSSYIGVTTTTLSRRLTMHLQNGAIRKHYEITHDRVPTRKILEENTKIIHRNNDKYRLLIMEAILIRDKNPDINRQDTGLIRTLKL